MKKQLPTAAISNELAQSVFFSKPPTARPNEGTGELSNGRTVEQAITPPPEQVNDRTPEVSNGRISERIPSSPPVKATTRSHERPNGRTGKAELSEKTE